MPSFSPQQATTSLPSSVEYPFPALSPIPTLSRGCECFPVTDQTSITHLSLSAPSLSPQYAAPIAPTQNSHAQAIANPDGLGLDFSAATGSLSLPAVHPSLYYNPSSYEEECEFSYTEFDLHTHHSRSSVASVRPTRPLTPRQTSVRPGYSKWSTVFVSATHLRDFAGCRSTCDPLCRPSRILVWFQTDQTTHHGAAKVRPHQVGQEEGRFEERLEPGSCQIPRSLRYPVQCPEWTTLRGASTRDGSRRC